MPRLPNSERAILDVSKLEDYCLDPAHPRGRHKARVFRESINVTRTDAFWLREALLSGLQTNDAVELAADRLALAGGLIRRSRDKARALW